MLYAIVGLVLVVAGIGIIMERYTNKRAKKKGNGYDKLAEQARQCRCKDI